MGCIIDDQNPNYKQFSKELNKNIRFLPYHNNIEKNTENNEEELKLNDTPIITSPTDKPTDIISVSPTIKGPKAYLCRMCRTPLFVEDHLDSHSANTKHTFEKKRKDQKKTITECTSYFISENLQWMDQLSEVEGKLSCPSCKYRVGSWNWAGMQCSCGTWVRPAFQFVKK